MLRVRKSSERGEMSFGWLKARHSFSFGHYFDPQHMGFSQLRVINQDSIQAGMGFDTHPHRNMEIISYIVEGALEHKDSQGHQSIIRPGDIQVMSAGRGIRHSEFATNEHNVEMLQIWIEPNKKGLEPNYQQKTLTRVDGLQKIVSPDGSDGSLKIHQDAFLFRGLGHEGQTITYDASDKRQYWVQLIHGNLQVNGQTLSPGDGLAIAKESKIEFFSQSQTEFLFFDLT